MSHRYQLIHPACGKPAFYYDHHPLEGERFRAESCILLDGSRATQMPMLCDSCGERLMGSDVSVVNIRPVLST